MNELPANSSRSDRYRQELEFATGQLLDKFDLASSHLASLHGYSDEDFLNDRINARLKIGFSDDEGPAGETDYLYQLQPLETPAGRRTGYIHSVKKSHFTLPLETKDLPLVTRRELYNSIRKEQFSTNQPVDDLDNRLIESLQCGQLPSELSSIYQLNEATLYTYSSLYDQVEKIQQSSFLIEGQPVLSFTTPSPDFDYYKLSNPSCGEPFEIYESEFGQLEYNDILELESIIDLIVKNGQQRS